MSDELLTIDGHVPETPRPCDHFTWEEVACQHSHVLPPLGALGPDTPFELLCRTLEKIRVALERPLVVTSWYRSPQHPIEVAKQKKHNDPTYVGPHSTGCAVDLLVEGEEAVRSLVVAHQLAMTWDSHPLVGFGLKQKGKDRFLHLDFAGLCPAFVGSMIRHGIDVPRPALWTY